MFFFLSRIKPAPQLEKKYPKQQGVLKINFLKILNASLLGHQLKIFKWRKKPLVESYYNKQYCMCWQGKGVGSELNPQLQSHLKVYKNSEKRSFL